jgi:U3 small nucleolar RNA-associated protein 7
LLNDVQFVPYEDFLGIGLKDGFSSIVIPGAGEANFDSFEVTPYQTKKQRNQQEVIQLLDKVQHLF